MMPSTLRSRKVRSSLSAMPLFPYVLPVNAM